MALARDTTGPVRHGVNHRMTHATERVEGLRAFVTGGGSGIGRATAVTPF